MGLVKWNRKIATVLVAISIINFASVISFANNSDYAVQNKMTSVQEVEAQHSIKDQYSMRELFEMSQIELIQVLESIEWHQIQGLFKMNDDAVAFYSNEGIMNTLIDALTIKGQQFTADDSLGISTIVEVLRAGHYLGFYNKELAFLNEDAQLNKLDRVLSTISRNPNFGLGTDEQDKIVSAFGLLINNTKITVEAINNVEQVVKTYADNYDEYIKSPSKNKALFDIISGIEYKISGATTYKRISPEDSIFYKRIDGYLNQLYRLGTENQLKDDEEKSIITNAIYEIAFLGQFHSDNRIGQRAVTLAMRNVDKQGELYLQCVERLDKYYDGKTSDGSVVNFEEVKEKAKEHYLPSKYVFDNGNIIITAGAQVTVEKIQRLYWAAKEVEAQFFRAYNKDEPIDQGHTDDILNIVIYNSPEEYEMNRLLNGIDTNNGGMYIEGDGTFYTYERKESESIYTLEELFRHEFTHYLQGRYVVPGLWGESDIYKDDRLPWYEEGGAEFFAGSTRLNGVQPRKSMVSGFVGREADWYDINKTVHSGYGTFEFYKYSYVLIDLMYKDKDVFNDLSEVIMDNNVSGYDAFIQRLGSDAALNRKYQDHLQKLSNQYDELDVPLVSDDYLSNHSVESVNQLIANVSNTFRLQNIELKVDESQFFNTFTIEGTVEEELSNLDGVVWEGMSRYVDQGLKRLSGESWTGYKTLTGYFTNLEQSGNKVTSQVVIRGLYTDSIENAKANSYYVEDTKKGEEPNKEEPKKEEPKPQEPQQEENENLDPRFADAKGQLYNDIMIEGELTPSTGRAVYYFDTVKSGKVVLSVEGLKSANLVVLKENEQGYASYNQLNGHENIEFEVDKGRYYVVMWTNSGIQSFRISGNELVTSKNAIGEKEHERVDTNETLETARSIETTTQLSSDLLGENTADYYKFSVSQGKKININLSLRGRNAATWVVRRADNMDAYYGYGHHGGNTSRNSIDFEAGDYYLIVYKFEMDDIEYDLDLSVEE